MAKREKPLPQIVKDLLIFACCFAATFLIVRFDINRRTPFQYPESSSLSAEIAAVAGVVAGFYYRRK